MPRYDFDPSKISSTITVLPKDDYEFVVGEPKPFIYQVKSTGADKYGVRFPLTVAEGPATGKRVFFSADQDSDIGRQVSKAFMMAACGYGRTEDEENRYNAETADKDFSFDTDTSMVGDGWRMAMGQRVVCSLDINVDKQDASKQYQKFGTFRKL